MSEDAAELGFAIVGVLAVAGSIWLACRLEFRKQDQARRRPGLPVGRFHEATANGEFNRGERGGRGGQKGGRRHV